MSNSVRTLRRIDLSIIIPAFNEQKRIEQTLDRVDEFLRTRQYASEVIVVDDGSTDATGDIVRSCKAAMPRLSLHSFEKNRGKGAAVRTGMIARAARLACLWMRITRPTFPIWMRRFVVSKAGPISLLAHDGSTAPRCSFLNLSRAAWRAQYSV